jgi:hypothetical protein
MAEQAAEGPACTRTTFNGSEKPTSGAPTQSVAADGPLLSDTGSAQEQPSSGADAEPYDLGEDDGGADDDGLSDSEDYGGPGRHQENTELVAAAFRAAGNPKFQDVRLKPAKFNHCPDLTHREFALGRANRAIGSTTW